ncbi:hypothetical protein [Aurantimicrobium sp. MWH-Uga1]|uniref:hypothetical protein n=1 Tax=Aurantimicrobium sp. MWH-Uga1 TaxID=2079575 RepID=UPI000DED73B8|nr:hypothetical protein [Aurantimicrobium sp. MWH-Uga1]AXE54800.1 hypothetical protein AURUGA1_01119 [Aurantimicrobium sp. MWH-Uga1]
MRFIPVLAISIASLTLVGCSTTASEPIPTSSAVEQAPAFASDEEALSAAQAAYAEYLSVSDQILADGGNKPEPMKELVSPSMFDQESEGFSVFQANGWRGTGSSSFDSMHLQESNSIEISVYLCVDHSQTKVLNADESEVDLSDRLERLPLLVSFKVLDQKKLIINSSETWTGENFC